MPAAPRSSWNWAACLANIFWFAYRKMWVPVAALAVFFVGLNALGLISPTLGMVGLMLSIAATMATGALGTQVYRRHVEKLVAETAGLDEPAALARLRSKGGVSRQAVIIAAALAAALAAAMVLVGFLQARNERLRNEQLRNEEQADRMRALIGVSARHRAFDGRGWRDPRPPAAGRSRPAAAAPNRSNRNPSSRSPKPSEPGPVKAA